MREPTSELNSGCPSLEIQPGTGVGYFVDKNLKMGICTLLLLSLPFRNQGLDNRSNVNGGSLSKVLIGGGVHEIKQGQETQIQEEKSFCHKKSEQDTPKGSPQGEQEGATQIKDNLEA
jgi:hypothetical protein